MARPPATITSTTYERLRGDILTGRLQPGERLKFGPLTERYGTSVSVLREALAKLSTERLVVGAHQQGFRVVSLSKEDLVDLTAVRVDIECLAFKYSIERGDLAWEGRILADHHHLQNTEMTVDGDPDRFSEAWAVVHGRFHLTLMDACGSPRLLDLATSLRDSAELYRRWSRPLGHDEGRDIEGEHQQLMTAALARDGESGVAGLRTHINRTTDALFSVLDAQHNSDDG
jgi:DNA-binding GntR family transcriptional regulator